MPWFCSPSAARDWAIPTDSPLPRHAATDGHFQRRLERPRKSFNAFIGSETRGMVFDLRVIEAQHQRSK
jgi:hypothetical protein